VRTYGEVESIEIYFMYLRMCSKYDDIIGLNRPAAPMHIFSSQDCVSLAIGRAEVLPLGMVSPRTCLTPPVRWDKKDLSNLWLHCVYQHSGAW